MHKKTHCFSICNFPQNVLTLPLYVAIIRLRPHIVAKQERQVNKVRIEFNNIRAEVARHNLTIEQLCTKLGIEKSTFYNWQKKQDLPASYAVEIASMFNVSTDYVLGVERGGD